MTTYVIVFLLLIVAFQGQGQPIPTTVETLPPAQTCRIVLRGNNRSTENFTLEEVSLHCWSGDIGGASPVNVSVQQDARNSSDARNATVNVRFGCSLLNYFQTVGWPLDLFGINKGWSTAPLWPSILQQLSNKTATTGLPPPSDYSSLNRCSNSDWGLDFLNVPHLKLVDTVISGLPLSSVGPLLQCLNCSFLTAQNVTLQSLQAGNGTSSVTPFGAFRATGLQGATLDHVQCSGVRGAVGWACILLQARPAAAVYIKDSSFVNNYAPRSDSSGQSTKPLTYLFRGNISDQCKLWYSASPGYGAVLIAYSADGNIGDSEQPPPPAGSDSIVFVERTVLSNNVGVCGAGIAVVIQPGYQAGNVNLTFMNSTVTNNTADAYGGGIFFSGCSGGMLHLAMTNQSTLSFNTAQRQGGGAMLFSSHTASMNLSGTDASYNKVEDSEDYGTFNGPNGGGVYIQAHASISPITIYDSNLSHNEADNLGGAICALTGINGMGVEGAVLDIKIYGGSTLHGNRADSSGGAVYARCLSCAISLVVDGQSILSGNTAEQSGGAIALDGQLNTSGLLHLHAAELADNQAKDGAGGAIYLNITDGQVHSVNIGKANLSRNVAKCSSGCKSDGGGIYIRAFGCALEEDILLGQQAYFANNTAYRHGGAVFMACNSSRRELILNGSTFFGNTAQSGSGGAVYYEQSNGSISVSLSGANFSSNTARISGGGFYLNPNEPNGVHVVRIEEDSVVSSNSAWGPGGFLYMYCKECSVDLTINGSNVTGNNAGTDGGAICIKSNGNLNVDVTNGSTINFNRANDSGGAMNLSPRDLGKLRIGGASSVSGNLANSSGGAFSIIATRDVKEIQIVGGSLILNNTATTGNGGGVSCELHGSSVIGRVYVSDGSRLENNTAGSNGGAVYLNAPTNSCNMTWDGGSKLAQNQAGGMGGGMYVESPYVAVNVLGASQWSENTAKTGGGGALYVNHSQTNTSAQVVIGESSQISRNCAQNGGAIFVNGFASLHVDGGSTLTSNTADYDGGALYLAKLPSEARLRSCEISGNQASRGSGGGLYIATVEPLPVDGIGGPDCVQALSIGNISIWNASFSANTAGVADGGAIFLTSHETCNSNTNVKLHVTDSRFSDNTALGAGGAIAVRDDSGTLFAVAIRRSQFINNTAGTVTGDFTSRANFGGAVLIWREPADIASNLTASCQLKAEDTSFEANNCHGGTGGAVMLISCSSEFSGCNFTANRAMLSGGAVGALHVARSTATLGLPTTSTIAASASANVKLEPQQRRLSMQRRRRLLDSNITTIGRGHVGVLPAGEKAALVPLEAISDAAAAAAAAAAVITTYDGNLAAVTLEGHRRKLGDDNILSGSTDDSGAQWKITLLNSTFRGNSADLEYGGALYLYAPSNAGQIRLVNCIFAGNVAVQQIAGAAFLAARGNGTNVQVTGCFFDNNTAHDSAGALYTLVGSGACAAISYTTLTKNQAAVSGGACILDVRSDGSLLMQNSTAKDNVAVSGDGGALQLHLQQGGRVDIIQSNFTNNIAAGNGGAVLVDANCSSSLAVQDVKMSSNRASMSGGAIYVSYGSKPARAAAEGSAFGPAPAAIDSAASPCTNMSNQRAGLQGEFSNNTAGGTGGAVFLAPAGSLSIFNSTMQSNVACGAGGSVAAENCSSLVMQYTVITDSRTLGSGGGFYAHGCRRLLLEYTNVTGNKAACSGGGLRISGVPDVSSSSNSSSSSSSAVAFKYTSLIFHRGQVSGNDAAAARPTVDVPAGSCSNGVCSYFGRQQQLRGLGGGLLITGKVVSVLNRLKLDQPNYATFGMSIATTQRCKLTNESSSSSSSSSSSVLSYPTVIDPIEISAWDAYACWNRLETLASMQCWILQMSDVLLPPVATNSSILLRSSSAGSISSESSSRQDMIIWVEDFLASALQVKCTYDPSVTSLVQTLVPEETFITSALAEVNARRYNVLRELVSIRLNETIDKLVNRTDFFGLQVLDMVTPDGTLPEAAVIARNSTGMPQRRFRWLISQLVDCVSKASPNNVSLNVSQTLDSALKQQSYVGLPPSYMALQFSGEELQSTQLLQLQSGAAFNLIAQLYDMFHQRVTSEVSSSNITLVLRPRGPDGGPYIPQAANESAPWLDAGVPNLDPGLNKSLEVPVVNGSATWTGVTVYAWPGLYSLLLSFKPGYSSNVNVTPLEMSVVVLPCHVGETLDLSRTKYKASWTGCKTCPAGQYGLWQDSRPNLTAINPTDQEVEVANDGSATKLNPYFQAMNNTLLQMDSKCQSCPDNGLCLGGSVVVPKPGHWHSAPNSTRIHECPNPTACNVDGDVKSIPGSVLDMLPYMDYRTRMLAWCQLGWYISVVVPGEAVQRAYNASRTPPSPAEDITVELQQDVYTGPLLLNGAISPSDHIATTSSSSSSALSSGGSGGLELPRCLLHGLSSDDPDSYMQQQCAEGYTGNLCASCVPNYYVDSDFNCKRCASTASTIALGLVSFFCSVLLVLFTTVTNFAEGFGEKDTGEANRQTQPIGREHRHRVEVGDVVKVIVLHLQYLIIVTRLSVDYPDVILRCQSVFSTITGAENYLVYSPSCLLRDIDSAGQALIQWLAGILTPCAVVAVSMVLWTLRYAIPLRKTIGRTAANHVRSLWTGFVGLCKTLAQPRARAPQPSRLDIPSTIADDREEASSFSSRAPRTEQRNLNHLPVAAPRETSWKAQDGGIGLCTVFRDVQVVALDAAVANMEGALANKAASLVPTPQASVDALPTVLSTAACAAPVLDLDGAELDGALSIPEPDDLRRSGGKRDGGDSGGGDGGSWQQHHGRGQTAANTQIAAAGSMEDQLGRLSDPPGILRAGDPISPFSLPCYQGPRDMYMLPEGIRIGMAPSGLLSGADNAAFIPYYHRYPYELWHRKTPKTLSHMGSAAIHDAIKTWNKLRVMALHTQQSSHVAIEHVDKVMSLREQLGVVLMAAVFILYPSWAHAALSTFACYPIDDNEGPFPEAQQATWKYGYWVRNMQAMCYSGNHLRVYVPVGIMAVGLFCLLPPLASFLFVWRVRRRLNDAHIRKVYGFLYKRYKPRFIWWETVLQVETLILVSVEILGRGLNVSYQALLLLAAFTVIALVNMSCAPLLSRQLVIMEFMSLGTLSLTITLSLYFTIDGGLSSVAENCLAVLIITLNTSLIGFFLYLASQHFWPAAARKVAPKAQAMLQKLSSIASTTSSARHTKGDDMQGGAKQYQERLACFSRRNRFISRRGGALDGGARDAALTMSGDTGGGPSFRRLSDEFSGKTLLSAADSDVLRAASAVKGMDIARASVCLEERLSNTSMAEPVGPLAPTTSHVCIQLDEIR